MRRDLIQDHRAHHRPNSHPNGERERCARGFPRKTTLRSLACDTLLSTERGHAEGGRRAPRFATPGEPRLGLEHSTRCTQAAESWFNAPTRPE